MSKTLTLTCKDNLSSKDIKVQETNKPCGTIVKFLPDYKRFGEESLPESNIDVLKFDLMHLSMTYPNIKFSFNGKNISIRSLKDYAQMYGSNFEIISEKGIKIIVLPNETDNFKFIHFINALNVSNGGEPLKWVVDNIVNGIHERLSKKYKTIKKGDIKNKLFCIVLFDGMFNPRFGDQIKSVCTNKYSDFSSQIDTPDWNKFISKVMKNSAIVDPITEVYKIKEELRKRQEMKGLEKTVKKIKSDKYYPAIGQKKYLIVTEGASASGGLMPVLGRENFGYFELKGKPLNSYSADSSKFAQNKELTDLYKVIQNEGYEKIITGTDQDLDGSHIRYLLLGFIFKYLPEWKDRFGVIQTPIMATKKGDQLQRWIYNFNETLEVKSGETSKYFKGLGSIKEKDFKQIIAKDGLEKMIQMIEFDNDELLDDWLSDKKADKRKEFIMNNEFDITKV